VSDRPAATTSARHDATARATPRARIHLTGAGGWGIVTCLAIAAAAANTANNLLYLLLALLLASYVISAWTSRRTLLRLTGELVAPSQVRRGEAADVVASLATSGRHAPGIVLELHVQDARGVEASAPAVRSVPVVEPGSPTSVSLPLLAARRGPATLRLIARSPFPFGLIESEGRIAEEEILVLPTPDPSWRRAVEDSSSDGSPVHRKGEGTEIFNIRNYHWGEDARRMDWKATARLGRPMLREYSRETQRSVVIVLPPFAEGGEEAAERAISRAAGAAEDLGREGWQLRLLAPGADVRGDAHAILRALARLDVATRTDDGWWRSRVAPGESVLELKP
jgi:uncharacterized protein (DUF58 family)